VEQLLLVLAVMEDQAETQSFIPQHIHHIPQLNLFVEQVVDRDQVGIDQVLQTLVVQVVVMVDKIVVHPIIILLEQQ
jgi:hypothetical protein